MGSHEQTNWQYHLTDRIRNPEGTHSPQNQSLRLDRITSYTPPTDHSPSSSGILNGQQTFDHLGRWGTSWHVHESPQLLEPPVIPSQPENVQEVLIFDSSHTTQPPIVDNPNFVFSNPTELSTFLLEQTPYSQSFQEYSYYSQIPYDSSSSSWTNTIQESLTSQEIEPWLDKDPQNFLGQWDQQGPAEPSHERSQQTEPSRPDRTLQELKAIAQAYITADSHKNLPTDIKKDIKARPFTTTEVSAINLFFPSGRRSETKKLQDAVYAQSIERRKTIAAYNNSPAGTARSAKSKTKRTSAKAKRTNTLVFKVQDFGNSSQHK